MPSLPKKNTLNAHIFLISVLVFVVFISLLWSDSQSLIAHDEGLYARRAKLIYDSGDCCPHLRRLTIKQLVRIGQ